MIMSRELEDALLALGWTEIHQSDLGIGRRCRAELRWSLLGRSGQRPTTLAQFMGTLFDRAMCAIAQEGRGDWSKILREEWDRVNGYVWDRTGRIDHWSELRPWVVKVHESGHTMASMAKELLLELERHNLRPVTFQTHLSYGGRVPFVGTRDLMCEDLNQPTYTYERRWQPEVSEWTLAEQRHFRATHTRPERVEVLTGRRSVLVDLKTYGLWSHWLYGESVKAQDWAKEDLTWLPQLRHYHWLSDRVEPEWKVGEYAFICPTNLIPYQKGENKGQRRGAILFRAPASRLQGYESDLLAWLKSFAESQPRDYPSDFGKPKCTDCKHRKPCLEGSTVDVSSIIDQLSQLPTT